MRAIFIFLVLQALFSCAICTNGVHQAACESAELLLPPYSNKSVSGDFYSEGLRQDVTCSLHTKEFLSAVFYRVSFTPGSTVTATTCSSGTNSGTLMAALKGYACATTECVASSSEGCLYGSSITFVPTQPDYYIMVAQQYDSFYNSFELIVNEEPPCFKATEIPGPYDPPVTVSGYLSLTSSNVDAPCDIDTECMGAWFTIYPAYGALVTASTCGNYTGSADTILAVVVGNDCASGDCLVVNDDQCDLQPFLSTATFTASKEFYYIYVAAYAYNNGTYELTVSETNAFSASKTPQPTLSVTSTVTVSSSMSLSATPTRTGNPSTSRTITPSRTPSKGPSPSSTVTRTRTPSKSAPRTITSTPGPSVTPSTSPSAAPLGSSCAAAELITDSVDLTRATNNTSSYTSSCSGSANRSPAYWFKLEVAEGSVISLSTCASNTSFDTQIGVVGSCNQGSCLAFNDDDFNCPVASASSLQLTVDQSPLYAFVTGYGDSTGNFELVVTVT